MNETHERQDFPEQLQAEWQRLGQRLRLLLNRTLTGLEKEIEESEAVDMVRADALEKLSCAGLHAMMIEQQAATMAYRIARDTNGF